MGITDFFFHNIILKTNLFKILTLIKFSISEQKENIDIWVNSKQPDP